MPTQILTEPDHRQVKHAAEAFKLLSDPTRLSIIWALLHGEHSVNDLADHVNSLPSAVSQHLAKLRLAHLVQTRRDGTRIFYLINDEHVRGLVEAAVHHAAHVETPTKVTVAKAIKPKGPRRKSA